MKSYKKIRVIKEADADEYVPEVDDIDDIADGEQEFVDLHTAMTLAHPVAGDNQFKSDKDSVEQKGATTDNAEGEDKPVKSGTTGDTKFAQFRDKIGKTPARKGDKSQGDMKAGTVKEEVELDEAQKLFMFKTKPEADKKAKEIKGKVISLGPKNFAVVTMDLTVVKEEVELDESVKEYDVKIKVGSKTNSYNIMAKDELSAAQSVLHSVMARSRTGGSPGLDAVRKSFPDMKSLKKKGISVSIKEEVELDEAVKAGALELVDGEVVDVSNDDADIFNIVLEDLSEENRDLMLIRMHEGADSYEQMLTFAREYA